MSIEKQVQLNFLIPKKLKDELKSIARAMSVQEDRDIGISELIRKMIEKFVMNQEIYRNKDKKSVRGFAGVGYE